MRTRISLFAFLAVSGLGVLACSLVNLFTTTSTPTLVVATPTLVSITLTPISRIPTLVPPTATFIPPTQTPASVSQHPKAGNWKATADFSYFILGVNADGSAIESIDYNFTALKCDGMTHSGGMKITFGSGLSIDNGNFSIQTDLSMDPFAITKEILTIDGKFSPDGKTASGDWADTLEATVCASGTWNATPDTP